MARAPLSTLRKLLVATLVFLVTALGSAQVRETVLVTLQEQGVQRMYETEVHLHGVNELHQAERRMGRKPFEQAPVRSTRIILTSAAPRAPFRRVAAARAPPHAPRAPPLA